MDGKHASNTKMKKKRKDEEADCEVITLFSLAAQLPKQSKGAKSQRRGHVPVPNHQHPTT
jgi:hypothetical protein